MADLSERKESLWWLTVSPTIWLLHLLASYITAAIWCEKVVARGGPLAGVRTAIVIYTAVALTGVCLTGYRGYRHHHTGSFTGPHDFDTREDRHRFLGFATLLLSGLSAVAIAYVAVPLIFIGSCR